MNEGMPTTTHRTAIAAARLRNLAARWQVSEADVVRRSLEQAEGALVSAPDNTRRIDAARRLRESLRKRNIDVTAWDQTAKDSLR